MQKKIVYIADPEILAITPETVIIAHSAGCPPAVALLEKLNVKIKQVILVEGFIKFLAV